MAEGELRGKNKETSCSGFEWVTSSYPDQSLKDNCKPFVLLLVNLDGDTSTRGNFQQISDTVLKTAVTLGHLNSGTSDHLMLGLVAVIEHV